MWWCSRPDPIVSTENVFPPRKQFHYLQLPEAFARVPHAGRSSATPDVSNSNVKFKTNVARLSIEFRPGQPPTGIRASLANPTRNHRRDGLSYDVSPHDLETCRTLLFPTDDKSYGNATQRKHFPHFCPTMRPDIVQRIFTTSDRPFMYILTRTG